MGRSLGALVLLAAAEGFLAPRTTVAQPPRAAVRLCAARLPDRVSVFGRLAERECVAADGSTQTAAKPKWIPAYASRGAHVPRWRATLFGAAAAIDYGTFEAALSGLDFDAPLAAPPSEAARAFSREGALEFWELLGGADGDLGVDAAADALAALGGEDDGGLHWSHFEEALVDMSAVRSTDLAALGGGDGDWEASRYDEGASQLLADVGGGGEGVGGDPPPPPPPDDGERRTESGLYLG